MPLTSGVVIGMVLVATGAFLLILRRFKRAALLLIGLGALITLVTVVLVLLVAASQM